MFQWLKKYTQKPKSIEETAHSSWLKKQIHAPHLWDFHREAVARGVAVGIFAGIIPILPFQTLLAICIAILLRANLPIALLASWISNPITILPLAYFTYYIGNLVLGGSKSDVVLENFSWGMDGIAEAWSSFGIPFIVGLPIVAISAALLSYFLVILIWHSNDLFKKH